jgi:hypothetical protein
MDTTKRASIMLTTEALEALAQLTTPRKQGEFISKLIVDAFEGRQASKPGILERIESKLDKALAKGAG